MRYSILVVVFCSPRVSLFLNMMIPILFKNWIVVNYIFEYVGTYVVSSGMDVFVSIIIYAKRKKYVVPKIYTTKDVRS